jgi:hypothetical protein
MVKSHTQINSFHVGKEFRKRKNLGRFNKKIGHFFHKVGVNNTKSVKTSKRPSNMATEQTQV